MMGRASSPAPGIGWQLARACAGLLVAAVSLAAEPPPLEFRRIQVAEQAMSELELKGVYLPVKRETFDRLVRAGSDASGPPGGGLASRIASARYTARLEGDRLVNGEADLQIVHRAEGPVAMSLEPWNLVVEQTSWTAPTAADEVDDEAAAPHSEARIGYGENGQLTLLAPGSGELSLLWTLRGERDPAGQLAFSLQLPPSPLSQLTLDLPRGLQPLVSPGFASLIQTGVDGQEWDRWLLELSGQPAVSLRIAARDASHNSARRVLIRQQTTYGFAPEGIELQTQLQLDVFHQPLSQLPLQADPGLRLVEAHFGEQPLRWTDSVDQRGTQLVLEMPEPLIGTDHLVRLRCVAALPLGRRWRLPSLSARGETWLQGSATLQLPDSLWLQQLLTEGCHATSTTAGEAGGENLQIQYFEPAAEIEVVVQPRRGELLTRTGTSVNLGRSRTSAIQITELETTGAPRFELLLQAASHWNIDSIETLPAGVLEEWSQTGRTERSRLIQLRLREPLAVGRPLRVQIQAHGRGLRSDEHLTGPLLRLGEFADSTSSRRLVALATDAPNQIRLRGDTHLVRLAAGDLDEHDQRRLTAAPGALLYADGPGADELVVDLSSDPPNYSARIGVEADFSERKLELTYRVRVQPESSMVDRVLVQMSAESEAPLHWSWDAPGKAAVLAKRLPAEKPARGERGETWLIALPEQHNTAFDLLGRRTVELQGPVLVPLASLLGAAAQSAEVTIRAAEPLSLRIEGQELRAVAAETLPPTAYGSTRAAFRYDPLQDAQLRIERLPGGDQELAWIWSCELESRHYRDGKTLHDIVYRMENSGAGHLTLSLPESVEWLSARIDDRELSRDGGLPTAGQWRIPLPRGVRFPVVRVQYVAHASALRTTGTAAVVWPEVKQQVLRRTWTAWLPPGWAQRPEPRVAGLDSWQQRWFGGVLRPQGTSRFAPLSPSNRWQPAAAAAEDAPPALRQRAEQLLGRIWSEYVALGDAADRDSPLTWGELLSGWQAAAADSPARDQVWIDQRAIGMLGITSRSAVRPPLPAELDPAGDRDPASSGAAVLGSAGLALLVHPDLILVTSLRALIPEQHTLSLPELRNVRVVTEPDWPESVYHQGADLQRVPLHAWTGEPPLPQICWRQADRSVHEFLREGGWTAHRIPTPAGQADPAADSRDSFAVFQPLVFQAHGWAALLTAAGLALWVVRWRLALGLLLVAAAALLVWAVPPVLLPVAQKLLWGVLIGGLAAWFQTVVLSPVGADARRDGSRRSTLTSSAAAALLLVAVLIRPLGAQPAAGPPPVYQVLSPVGQQNEPAGDYVFVPREFYDALLQRSSGRPVNSQKWLIRDAAYRGVMNWNVAEEQLSVLELTATYELEVFHSAVQLLLPMSAEQVHLLPSRALLNGRPASVSWAGEGSGLEVNIDAPGVHRLELAFRPLIRRGQDYDSFDVAIPRAAGSRLAIELPAETAELEFPTALGSVRSDHRTGTVLVQLGPTQLLSVRWPAGTAAGQTAAALELDQLLWLRIDPQQVTLDARLRFSNLSLAVPGAELVVGPGLRLLPPGSAQPVTWSESVQGPSRSIHLEFKPPYQPQVELELSFLLSQATGVGRIPLPQIRALVDRTNRRWLAVTLAPGLQVDPPAAPAGGRPTPADFAAAWRSAEPPQIVLDLETTALETLAVRPLEPRATAEHHLDISCGLEAADLIYTANLQMTQGTRMQYELSIPPFALAGTRSRRGSASTAVPELAISAVSVEEDGEQRLLDWSRSTAGDLILRLNHPVTGDHRIRVQGRLQFPSRLAPGAVLTVPPWRIADVAAVGQRVDVYRDSQALVEEVRSTSLALTEGFQPGRYVAGRGRWAAALESPGGTAEGELQVVLAPNQPHITGTMVVRVQRETDNWWAAVDCRLQVADGLRDVIRFEIPAEWKGPFQIDPQAEVVSADLPGQGRRQLIVRPLEPVSGEFSIQLRAPLTASPRERVRAPDIVPLDVEEVAGYVVLPSRIDQQTIDWDRAGLQAKPLPEEFGPLSSSTDVAYETLRPRFQAVIKDIQVESAMAYVRWAEFYLDIDPEGRMLGVAAFDLEPAGRGGHELQIPEGTRVLRATAAELPVPEASAGRSRLPLPAGPPQLAQRIEVLFLRQLELHSQPPLDLAAIVPSPAGLPIEKTCWTIRRPRDAGWEVLSPDTATAAAQDALRLRNLARLIAKAEEVLQDGDPEQITRWYVPWARRWTAVRSRLGLRQELSGLPSEEALQLQAIDEEQQQIAQRLGVLPELESAEQQGWLVSETADVWRIAGSTHRVSTRVITVDGSVNPRLRRSAPPPPAKLRPPQLIVPLIGLLAVALVFAPPRPLAVWWRRYPQSLGVLLGALWWQFLPAAAIGLVWMSVSLVALLRQLARRRGR